MNSSALQCFPLIFTVMHCNSLQRWKRIYAYKFISRVFLCTSSAATTKVANVAKFLVCLPSCYTCGAVVPYFLEGLTGNHWHMAHVSCFTCDVWCVSLPQVVTCIHRHMSLMCDDVAWHVTCVSLSQVTTCTHWHVSVMARYLGLLRNSDTFDVPWCVDYFPQTTKSWGRGCKWPEKVLWNSLVWKIPSKPQQTSVSVWSFTQGLGSQVNSRSHSQKRAQC